ncbi:MAG: hypothetical protein JST60_09390 [Chloroflexi bacterium SZAS-1]|nr:hypothetical protein [Chloroflexi bacterium SZAS-1]HNP86541.1 hypothetical protein [Kouleothrix sp.]
MRLFRGMKHSDYQDVLRALGYFIDEHGYTDVRIIETEDGLVLQGRVTERRGLGEANYDTFLITDEDIKTLVRDAFLRRGQKPPAYSE